MQILRQLCVFLILLASASITAGERAIPAYQLPVMVFEKDGNGFYKNKTDKDYLRYMWESFVALNWPALPGQRGEPDKNASRPASRHPVVWETMAQPQEVFLPDSDWKDYPEWKALPVLPAGLTVPKAQTLCEGYSPQSDIILYDINQPNISIRSGPVAPLMDQHRRYVRYQVALNRPFFEYIRAHRYFDASVQQAAVKVTERAQYNGEKNAPPGVFVPLPFDTDKQPGMLEIKSAWRVLDPEFDRAERYYRRPGFILSPDRTHCERAPAGLGLVALHIHRLTRLSHAATTFEQVDNVAI
ncbi:MAG: hypothetical protein ABFS23_01445, partial [Pseudomonadota bacterium]